MLYVSYESSTAAKQAQVDRGSMVMLAAEVLVVRLVRTTSVPSEHDSESLIVLYSDLQIPEKKKFICTCFIYKSQPKMYFEKPTVDCVVGGG